MTLLVDLKTALEAKLADAVLSLELALGELTLTLAPESLVDVCLMLRDDPQFGFEQCLDVCGVDYLLHGEAQWQIDKATSTGFDRAVDRDQQASSSSWTLPRFAVVYHLLSIQNNQRLRLKVFLAENLLVPSLVGIWPSVNWFEREAFDLFGILFTGHPDLRRILTDYGFIGHPFRKDFPLSGHLEVRYDAAKARVVYEPVSVKPRVLVPKVIRTSE